MYATSKFQKLQKLENEKQTALNTLNQLFAKYPNDPEKIVFVTMRQQSESIDEINKVMDDSRNYLIQKDNENKELQALENHKNEKIQNIKDICGVYFSKSLVAQKLVDEIKGAKTINEVNKIYYGKIKNMKLK